MTVTAVRNVNIQIEEGKEDLQELKSKYSLEYGFHSLNHALLENKIDLAILLLKTASKAEKLSLLLINPSTKTSREEIFPIHQAVKFKNIKLVDLMVQDLTDEERIKLLNLIMINSVYYRNIRMFTPIEIAILEDTNLLATLLDAYPEDKRAKMILENPNLLLHAVAKGKLNNVKILLNYIPQDKRAEYIMTVSYEDRHILFHVPTPAIAKELLDLLTTEQKVQLIYRPFKNVYTKESMGGGPYDLPAETDEVTEVYYAYKPNKYNKNRKDVCQAILDSLPEDKRPNTCIIL
ncbi:MAG: hypothetical protein JXA94_03115 [Parachlamydiales bacterium]|nr:hypothetical protein [Parachlamydiales bacterium]